MITKIKICHVIEYVEINFYYNTKYVVRIIKSLLSLSLFYEY